MSTSRLHVYLRFGRPIKMQRFDGHLRLAFFAPRQTFCRVWWQANDYGTVVWTASVLRTVAPGQVAHRIVGVRPAAHVLVHAVGSARVRELLRFIDLLEATDLDLATLPVGYWNVVQNRLSARTGLPCVRVPGDIRTRT
jgi:hypothetical protein